MSRTVLPLRVDDISALARSLNHQISGSDHSPSHLELLNMLARSAGFRNFQHFRAQAAAHAALTAPNAPAAGVDYVEIKRLARFFDAKGRLIQWPGKLNQRTRCIWVLWSRLPARKALSEHELNKLLQANHLFADPALLRRELYDQGLVSRTPDCREYRRIEKRPTEDVLALIRHGTRAGQPEQPSTINLEEPKEECMSTDARIASVCEKLRPISIRTSRGNVDAVCWGEGPAVLSLHGAMGGYDQGILLAKSAVSPRHRFVAVSRPGYLGTPLAAGRTPEEQADVCAEVLDQLGIAETAVIAISGGGPAAVQFALRHAQRCAGSGDDLGVQPAPGCAGSVPLAGNEADGADTRDVRFHAETCRGRPGEGGATGDSQFRMARTRSARSGDCGLVHGPAILGARSHGEAHRGNRQRHQANARRDGVAARKDSGTNARDSWNEGQRGSIRASGAAGCSGATRPVADD